MFIIEIKHKSTNMMSKTIHYTKHISRSLATQRSKSSIDQIDMEFKSEIRSHCKI